MRIIKSDVRRKKGTLNRYFSKCIGAGRAAEVMRHAAYGQLKRIQAECPFEYIRFHGIFHDEMGIFNRLDDGSVRYNFQYLDSLLDSLLEINIRPVLELGLMPGDLRSGDETVFWWKMYKTPPRDFGEWEELIEALVRHVTARYGEEEIKRWYFEVWNEPDLESFFRSDDRMNDYFRIYDSAACAVKRVNSEYKVGGPATAGLRWIPDTVEHCRANGIPLDFISGHFYCVRGDFDSDGKRSLFMQPQKYYTEAVNKAGRECHAEGYPLFVTEWSASYSSRDCVHDSYFSAPFILHAVKACEGNAEMMSYWVYTDIFEETGIGPTPFHGGFGLINLQSLPKPSYYAYTMLSALGDDELECNDAETYVCRDGDEVQVLFWNSVMPTQNKELPNNVYFTRIDPPAKLEDARVSLSGLEAGREYEVCVETVGYKSGDVYTLYAERGFTDTPTREEIAALAEDSRPVSVSFSVKADGNGVLEFAVPQSENQADLVRIKL